MTMAPSLTSWYFVLGPDGAGRRVPAAVAEALLREEKPLHEMMRIVKAEWQYTPGHIYLTGVVLLVEGRIPRYAVGTRSHLIGLAPDPRGELVRTPGRATWDALALALLQEAKLPPGASAEARDLTAHLLMARWLGNTTLAALPAVIAQEMGETTAFVHRSLLSSFLHHGTSHAAFDLRRGGFLPLKRPAQEWDAVSVVRTGGFPVALESGDPEIRQAAAEGLAAEGLRPDNDPGLDEIGPIFGAHFGLDPRRTPSGEPVASPYTPARDTFEATDEPAAPSTDQDDESDLPHTVLVPQEDVDGMSVPVRAANGRVMRLTPFVRFVATNAHPIAPGEETDVDENIVGPVEHRILLTVPHDPVWYDHSPLDEAYGAVERDADRTRLWEEQLAHLRATQGVLGTYAAQEEVVLAELLVGEFPVQWSGTPGSGGWTAFFDPRDYFPHAEQGYALDQLWDAGQLPSSVGRSSIYLIAGLRVHPQADAVSAAATILGSALRWWSRGRTAIVMVTPGAAANMRQYAPGFDLPAVAWRQVLSGYDFHATERLEPTLDPHLAYPEGGPHFWRPIKRAKQVRWRASTARARE